MGRKKGKKKQGSKTIVATFTDAYKTLQTNSLDISYEDDRSVPIDAYYEEYTLEIDSERHETPHFEQFDNTLAANQAVDTSRDVKSLPTHPDLRPQKLRLPDPITVNIAGSQYYGGFVAGKVSFDAEPQNQYDNNAVAVIQNNKMIGHLPRVLVANFTMRQAILDYGCGAIDSFESIHITFNSLSSTAIAPKAAEVLAPPARAGIKPITSPNQPNKSEETMNLIDMRIDGNYLIINTDQGDFKNRIDYAPPGIVEKCKKYIGRNIKLTVRAGTGTGGKTWKELGWFVNITEAESETKSGHKKSEENSFETRLPLGRKFDGHTSQKVYGPPGTGKTTLMLDHVGTHLAADVRPEDIAFISFSNAGANAAKKRVSDSFPGYGSIDFPNFSTMHSLATKIGGGLGRTLCQEEHWKAFDNTIICYNEWTEVNDPSSIIVRYDHPVLDMSSLATARCTSFATEYDQLPINDRTIAEIKESLVRYFDVNILPDEIIEYSEKYLQAYRSFKEDRNLVDFNDVIERIISKDFDHALLPTFEVLIIDEAQDLSDFLWIFAKKLIERAKVVYVAGDDDQAIMINFGASPYAFLNLPTTEDDYPLPKSYRVPEEVMNYVRRGTLKYIEALPNRVNKEWETADHHGVVSALSDRQIQNQENNSSQVRYENFTVNDLILKIDRTKDEQWLVMAPTKATGQSVSTALQEQNPPIAHFYRNKPFPNLRKVEESSCRIRIQTVHTSKGDEAENVAIIAQSFGDVLMLTKDPRLAYVALTRAKKTMYPRVLAIGLLAKMRRANKKMWFDAAIIYDDMFPGQQDN